MTPAYRQIAVALSVALGSACAVADDAPVVVTATREPQSSADLPVSVDRIDGATISSGQLKVNLSETLDQVPGVVAQNRQNYAQDLQLSIRGFGARSSFGVRGVRLYADGIPGTMPDGQGQFSHFDLGSAERIEILRGPFSALYGNSSGGVISIFTESGGPGDTIEGSVAAGSLGLERYALKADGADGGFGYVVDVSRFTLDGYRDHSSAERNTFNTKLSFDLSAQTKLTLVGNAVETPFVQDALGLTRTQWLADPEQAGTNALAYNTRKSLGQQQVGASLSSALGDNAEIVATTYGGHRKTVQYQAILTSAEIARATHPGGVIDLARDYWGADLHGTVRSNGAAGALTLTGGFSYDALDEARRGYLNFVGTTLGVEGALRRDEANRVHDLDEYLELQWEPGARWHAIAGVRNSLVDVSSTNLLATGVGSPLTGVRYAATSPVAGITFRAAPDVNAYASYGKGFETPTLNDLAYRSTDGSLPGLNLGLKPARSDNYEVGLKAREGALAGTLAAFYVNTRNELAVATNSGGRSVYQNIDGTHRTGAELGLDVRPEGHWSGRIAYTYLRAVTTSAYRTCVGIPCIPLTIPEGNRLPAVPANSVYTGLTWQQAPDAFSVTAELIGRAQIYFDDRNSDAAPGYWVANLHATTVQRMGRWRLSESARIENVGDRRYAGTVIVNESNSRFLEPAPGRTFYVGVTASFGGP
jgi:iron complex outermembrane receptor protein